MNTRNGYRHRDFDTRVGTLVDAIPKLRSGSYFLDWLLERRKDERSPNSKAPCATLRAMSAAESWASSPGRRRNMRAIRSRDSQAELAVRRLLHARGLRYRVDVAPLVGLRRRADILFTRQRIAVFIDGCFWHGCPVHGRKTFQHNSHYWPEKIATNIARDLDTNARLIAVGWQVLRFWEHRPAGEVAQEIEQVVRGQLMVSPPASSTAAPGT